MSKPPTKLRYAPNNVQKYAQNKKAHFWDRRFGAGIHYGFGCYDERFEIDVNVFIDFPKLAGDISSDVTAGGPKSQFGGI